MQRESSNYIFPHMDEASKLLENLIVSQQELPTSYRKLSPNLPSTGKVIDLISSTVDPTLPLESETHITQVDDSLVDQVVDSISHSVNPILPLESELHTAQVLLVTSDSSTPGAFHLFLQNPLQILRSFPLIRID